MSKATIYSRFKDIVEKNPERVAIYQDDKEVTFSQLDYLVNALLSKIYAADAQDEDMSGQFVGIVMHHGYLQIAAMLAVLKSGAAYVPAEPALPADRINYMMRNAGVRLIIDDNFCKDLTTPEKDYPDMSQPDGIAYVLYTSGTTGKPKGVIIENHCVANYARAFGAEMKIGPGDVMLQYSICSFDIFVEEVFATLLNGAALAIPSEAVHNGPLEGLMDFCRRHNVTIIDGFPYLVADINHRPELLPPSVTLIVSGGDVVRENYISNLRQRGVRIYNTYGPSETCVCSNYYRIDNAPALEDGTYPVGKPVEGVDVRIFDENFKEMADGEVGEICIFGEGVGRGYLGNPPEQANFIKLPDGTHFYRSGDMGYRRSDGNIIFLHRRDDQVMILGRRVEPEEVENVLNEYHDIDRGIVRAFKDETGLHYLVAYIVPDIGFTLSGLKDWLKSKLADFMVPEFYVALHHIPLNSHGKVDMTQLPVVLKEGEYK
ncbi:MAG: amino acid adenylation domain-containing protein [Muribaculaceae bacterium]|nr:amino acid adenylation domain-containing protein [Muribaculaceae bacterium]